MLISVIDVKCALLLWHHFSTTMLMNEQDQNDLNGKAGENQQQETQFQPLNKPETHSEQDPQRKDPGTQQRQNAEQNDPSREKPIWNPVGTERSEQEEGDVENSAEQNKLQRDEEKGE